MDLTIRRLSMKRTLYEQLKSESTPISISDLNQILDEELAKDPDDIDNELVEFCASLIEKYHLQSHTQEPAKINVCTKAQKKSNQHKKSNKHLSKKITRKLLPFAAILALTMSFSLVICANVFHISIPEGFYEILGNDIRITHENGTADTYAELDPELADSLKQYGFDDVTLPSKIFESNYTLNKLEFSEVDLATNVQFTIETTKIDFDIFITNYEQEDLIPADTTYYDTSEATRISVNNLNVDIVYNSNNDISIIEYKDGNLVYHISCDCSFETAIEYAKTIK